MTIKTILTHAEPGGRSTLRIAAAAALARDLDALLLGMAAEAIPPIATADPYGFGMGQWIPLLYEQQGKNLETARQLFEAQASGTRTEWRSSGEIPTLAMARAARAADLIVTGASPHDGSDNYTQVDTGELILTAGRPVLVVPSDGHALKPRKILIAWKDCREARRAVADALPFLEKADETLILALSIQEDHDAAQAQAADVAAMLERHGIKNLSVKADIAAPDSINQVLMETVERQATDLIVAGGYGHSRAYEWVLGGVTRHLLTLGKHYVLFSH